MLREPGASASMGGGRERAGLPAAVARVAVPGEARPPQQEQAEEDQRDGRPEEVPGEQGDDPNLVVITGIAKVILDGL